MTTTIETQEQSRRWHPADWSAAAWVALESRVRRLRHDDRGDVPGWVLVTLMTAGLVTVIWALAKTSLQNVFSDAIDHVKPNP